MKKLILTLAALMVLPTSHVLANLNADNGLYDPVPPPGSAFVRFVSMDTADGSKEARVNNKALEFVRFKDVSSYFVTPEGRVSTKIGKVQKEFDIEAGNFYTIVLNPKQDLEIFQDEENNNQAKAQVIFYNFSPQKNLSLKTGDGKVEIVPSVETGKLGARQINPVKVPLAIYEGDKMVQDLGIVSMDRSHTYSVIAFPNNEAKWVASTTNTTR